MKGTIEILKWIWNQLKEWWLPIALFFILFYFKTEIVIDFPKWLTTKYYVIFPYYKQSDAQVQHQGATNLDPLTTGPIGDTFGGTLGPLIAIIAAYLTFLAFWIQYKANQQQKADLQIERFENKFYELLRLHKENLHETQISGYGDKIVSQRKAFAEMYKELLFAFEVTKNKYEEYCRTKESPPRYDDELLLKIAYIFFYAGIGKHSNIINSSMRPLEFDYTLFELIRDELEASKRNSEDTKEADIAELDIKYRPFEGHMIRLGHYYRHLFQTVKFIADENKLKHDQKLGYLRTLRAQLSDYEQVMLYYNALSKFGEEWITEAYFTKYKMIHNIPLPLASFGAKPEDKFKGYIDEHGDIFEWNGA